MSESQESDDNINSFHFAILSFEYLESLFHKEHIDWTEIRLELYKCSMKIESLIFEETADNNSYFVDLLQLKQLMSTLIKVVERKIRVVSPPKIPSVIPKKTETPAAEKEAGFIKSIKETPRVRSLQEIAGLWEAKKVLRSLVILPKIQPQLFINHKAYNSILLFGPPGTGKTRLVHALASEANADLYCVSSSALVSSLVGQTERNVRLLFESITSSKKLSVLFIDEVDGFCRTRQDNEQDHNRRLKTELLCQISNMEEVKNTFLICATNCPWDLDTAFLRRFHKRIYIPLPDSKERLELLHLFTQNTPLQEHPEHWEMLVEKTKGLSGSDISNLVQSALGIPITELEDTKLWKCSADGFYEPAAVAEDFNLNNIIYSELSDLPPQSVRARTVQMLDLFKSLNDITATVSATSVKRYETFIGREQNMN